MEPHPYRNPILNSPYAAPERHWQLDEDGALTQVILPGRRASQPFIPIARARAGRGGAAGEEAVQGELALAAQADRDSNRINTLREELEKWRAKPLDKCGVGVVTQELLAHWRRTDVVPRPFFCQLEAMETLIWLNEVAPKLAKSNRRVRDMVAEIVDANGKFGGGLPRLAAKMATGTGKTTVMAMLVVYHAVNYARAGAGGRGREKFANKFLVVAPGITIRERLRVLLPQDPENCYETQALVPRHYLPAVRAARVVVVNFHAFRRREREKEGASVRGREMLRGRRAREVDNRMSEFEVLHKICPQLLEGPSPVVVMNDEAHHCYREREEDVEGNIADPDEREEARQNSAAARVWINGILSLRQYARVHSVYDLSATPFFLRGSGYPEGTMFPWAVSDFSLMDAIEAGIVKLPSVPVRDVNTTETRLPTNRDFYDDIRARLPRRVTGAGAGAPGKLPDALVGALRALYAHYEKVDAQWTAAGMPVPPVFIVVCSNTAVSKMVYEYVAGHAPTEAGGVWHRGALPLFCNVNARRDGFRARLSTLLIDSRQLESGEAMTPEFKRAAAGQIAVFENEVRMRYGLAAAARLDDADLLREVTNTVGKAGRLGGEIRCVVSVAMLTEGWDASNVTHILGVRAFGTQLLCEQVVGRALRRQNYEVAEEEGRLGPEHAYIFGIPFKFVGEEGGAPPRPPEKPVRVMALEERRGREIVFPRVAAYRVIPAPQRIVADFSRVGVHGVSPKHTPSDTELRDIIGGRDRADLSDLRRKSVNQVVYALAARIARDHFADAEGGIAPDRFRDLVGIVRYWLEPRHKLVQYEGGTFLQYFLLGGEYQAEAAEHVFRACAPKETGAPERLLPVLQEFEGEGSTAFVDFLTRKRRVHATAADKCHINYAACDSDWEVEFCRLLESTACVLAYARNDRLGLTVPYVHEKRAHVYLPDFVACLDDGRGEADALKLVVEIKGYRSGRSRAKADTMRNLWIPAVNNAGKWGRWAFVEIFDPRYLTDQPIRASLRPENVLAAVARGEGV